MQWRNFFLPHPQTHKKAHLISWEALLIYILLFIFLQVSLNIVANLKPGILGITSNIDQHQLITLTNEQRAKFNLPPVTENSLLDLAAQAKAKNMFEENYWAHYSPSGKDPWGFILSSGYKFSYAGENLARNFYTSSEVVDAWIASPSHKENIVNPKYHDIGIAVVEGVLNGQKTTLVVQMFGSPIEAVAIKPTINVGGEKIALSKEQLDKIVVNPENFAVAGEKQVSVPSSFSLDYYSLLKGMGFGLILMLAFLLMVDIYTLRKRGVFRLSSSHLPHLALLSIAASALFSMHPGSIL